MEVDKKETEKRYLDNVKQLEGAIAKVTSASLFENKHSGLSFQMKVTQAQISQNYSAAQQNNQLLESKLKESQETNSKLDSDLQVASLHIVSSTYSKENRLYRLFLG